MSLHLEVIQGVSEGRNGSFEETEITIGRGAEVDFRLAAKDVAVGRGAHCRVFAVDSESELPRVRVKNEHRNRLWVRNSVLEVVLDQDDQVDVVTPGVIEFAGGGPIIELRTSDDPLPSETQSLLDRSRLGDEAARQELIEEHMSWVHAMVRKKMGPHLRDKVESIDMVQAVALGFLGEKNRHYFRNGEELRNYLVKVIEHKITDEDRRQKAQKRDKRLERPLEPKSSGGNDPMHENQERPSQVLGRKEREERLASLLDEMDPDVRVLLVQHEIEGWTFAQIGLGLGMGEDAVRMRYKRALEKLREQYGDGFEL